MVYALIRPVLSLIDPERAHGLAIAALKTGGHLVPARWPDPRLASHVAGIAFPGPVGLAAGFDKDGEVAQHMARFGFGFAELGTLTPFAQAGNPRPRLFRLTPDRAVINRMGFNNQGQASAKARLSNRPRDRVIGINIGANKDATDRIADYAAGVSDLSALADYLTVNISSPNTPGLRALQDEGALDALLEAVMAARAVLPESERRPIFLKVAPDLEPADVEAISRLSISRRVDALIVSNTTIGRPTTLRSTQASESGGLSGGPLHDLALRQLKNFREATEGAIPLIGVGGIETGAQAYARIRAGASLVQLYSALVFEGPWLADRINRELLALIDRDGFATIAQAVGMDARAG